MRAMDRRLAPTFVAALASIGLAACQSSDLPMPDNGPNSQSFSTNNALVRVVDGSPTAGTAGCTPATCAVDVVIDGTNITAVLPSGLPYTGILPYVSVPAGQALVQIFQHGTANLVTESPVAISAGGKYSFVLAGTAPALPPAPPFFPFFLIND